jgi:kynurenine 3-monooxygenase
VSRIAVAGAGPAGAYVAGALAAVGHRVLLLDRREDPASEREGSTIQLSLSPRGVRALARVGLAEAVLARALPLEGRAFHPRGGEVAVLRPKDPSWQNHSVSRSELTRTLLDWALGHADVEARLGDACVDVTRAPCAVLVRSADGSVRQERVDAVIGADGVASAVRAALVRAPSVDFSKKTSAFGYAELTVTAGGRGEHRYETPAIHIWPRERFFLVGFPARDGTYRCTLVLPRAAWTRPDSLERIFSETLPDVVPHLARPLGEILRAPLSPISIVRCGTWTDGERLLVLGDAAHATAPFMGQGVNLALEDASELAYALETTGGDLPEAFRRFSASRVPEGIACCDLSERAASALLKPPDPRQAPEDSPLSLLNFRGHSYAEVARRFIPGWTPSVYADVAPPSTGGVLGVPTALMEQSLLSPDERLFERGAVADALYVLESGTVCVESPEVGRIRLSGPTVVGEMGWFGTHTRTADVVAEGPCVVGRVSYVQLERYCREQPGPAVELVRALSAMAMDRLKGQFHERGGYLALLATPGSADALSSWVAAERERLGEHVLLSDAALGPRLEQAANVRVARWVRPLALGGVHQLESLALGGGLKGVVAFQGAETLPTTLRSVLSERGLPTALDAAGASALLQSLEHAP